MTVVCMCSTKNKAVQILHAQILRNFMQYSFRGKQHDLAFRLSSFIDLEFSFVYNDVFTIPFL